MILSCSKIGYPWGYRSNEDTRNIPTFTSRGVLAKPGAGVTLAGRTFQGERSVHAWHLWKESTDVETNTLDFSSFRLLPHVYRNLRDQGLSDPLIEKLKGIYRLHWYKNQRLFHHMTPVLKSFHAAGIKTMILKGQPYL